jgi:hypothetical protein
MKITIQIKLKTTPEQHSALSEAQKEFAEGLNRIVVIARATRCWNQVDLHKSCYSVIRSSTALKSQMVCSAIRRVCTSIKALRLRTGEAIPSVEFKSNTSTHYDRRTY